MGQKDKRYMVEQHLLPSELYTSGPTLLYRVMGNVNAEMKRFYERAGADFPGDVFEEAHRVYTHDEISVLIIRVGMPAPTDVPQSRAVYLCYCDKNGENLLFTSELSINGKYLLCCRPDSERAKHILCGDAPESAAEEFDMVAENYWGLVINDGLKQLESLRAG